mgnify:CR=1 FL=1
MLGTMIVGIVTLNAFDIYEWKFTTTGILHHDLFQGGGGLWSYFRHLCGPQCYQRYHALHIRDILSCVVGLNLIILINNYIVLLILRACL